MKRGGPTHPKTEHFASLLELTRYEAVGILECLFHWAGSYARRGDVGKFPNRAIAQGIGWHGDPDQLIRALVDSNWLAACPCHRLRIHDWHEHADQAVKKTKEVISRGFLECYVSGGPPESLFNKDGGPPPPAVRAVPTHDSRLTTHDSRLTAQDPRPTEANPLVPSRAVQAKEAYELVTEIAPRENLDPTEVARKASTYTDRRGTVHVGKVRIDALSDDALSHTLADLRAWKRRLEGIPEPEAKPRASPSRRMTAAETNAETLRQIREEARRGGHRDVHEGADGDRRPALASGTSGQGEGVPPSSGASDDKR